MDWFSEFYTTIFYVSDIGANSFAQFQLDSFNSAQNKYLKKKEKTLFETNMKLRNIKFDKTNIWEEVASRKKVITKDYYLKF